MKNVQRIAALVVVASLSMGLFAGCGSKTGNTNETKSTATAASSNPGSKTDAAGSSDNKKGDPAGDMKTIYSDVLKTLVSNNTITQAQADKVLEVVTKTAPQGGSEPNGTPAPNGSKSGENVKEGSGAKPDGTPPANVAKPSGTPAAEGAKPNGAPQNDRLSELVSSKVITQAQADTINQKVQEAMKNSQGPKTK